MKNAVVGLVVLFAAVVLALPLISSDSDSSSGPPSYVGESKQAVIETLVEDRGCTLAYDNPNHNNFKIECGNTEHNFTTTRDHRTIKHQTTREDLGGEVRFTAYPPE